MNKIKLILIAFLLINLFALDDVKAADLINPALNKEQNYKIVNGSAKSLQMVQATSTNAIYSTADYTKGLFDDYTHIIESHNIPTTVIDNNSGTSATVTSHEIILSRSVDFVGLYFAAHGTYTSLGISYTFYDSNDEILNTIDVIPRELSDISNHYLPFVQENVKKIELKLVGNGTRRVMQEIDFFVDPASLYSSVENLKATNVKHNSITVGWNNLELDSLTTNKIYLNDNLVDTKLTTNYTFNNLEPKTEYKITVSAVYNNIEIKSELLVSTIKDPTPPKDPTSFNLMQQQKSIVLNWINATDNDFSHVKIFKNGTLWKDNVTATSIIDYDINYNSNYTYKIVSVDLDSNESQGITKSIKAIEPTLEVIDLKAIAPDYTKVELSWKNPTVEGFETVTIYRKVEETGLLARARTLFAGDTYDPIFETNGTVFKDLTVTANTTYEYKVTTTFAGEETPGVITKVTTPEFQVIKPELGKTDDNSGDFLLKWDLPITGQVKIIIDGKEFAVVNAADKQKLIPANNMKYDVLGNPRLDLIQVVAIDENGTEGAIVKPNRPGGGSGSLGGLDINASGINAIELLKMGVGLLTLVGIFVLLGLSFPMARKLILTIRKAILKKSIIKGG